MKPIELVVFDIAGTTVKDAGNINDCFREAFQEAGISVEKAEVDTVMGYRKIDAVRMIVEKNSQTIDEVRDQIIDKIHTRFNELMISFYKESTTLEPLPFAEQIFGSLQQRQIKVALNTGFTRIITNAIIERLSWNDHPNIDLIICSDEVEEGRPAAYMIQHLMKSLNINDAEKVVKVGDTEVDILEGRNAGCGLVVAVTTGAYTKEQLVSYEPDHIIDSLEQLLDIIQSVE